MADPSQSDDIARMLEAEIAGEMQHMQSGEGTPQPAATPPAGRDESPTAATAAAKADAERQAAMEAEMQRRIRDEVEARIRAEFQAKHDAEVARARAAAEEAAQRQAAEEQSRREREAASAARAREEAEERIRAEVAARVEQEEARRAEEQRARDAEAARREQEAEFERQCAEAEAKEQANRDASERELQQRAAAEEAERRLQATCEAERAEAARREQEAEFERQCAEAEAKEQAKRDAAERVAAEEEAARERQRQAEAVAQAAREAAAQREREQAAQEAEVARQRDAEAAKQQAESEAAAAEAKRAAAERMKQEVAERVRREMEAAMEQKRLEYEAKIQAMQERLERTYSGDSPAPQPPAVAAAAAAPAAARPAEAQLQPRFSSSDDEDEAPVAKPGPSKRQTSAADLSASTSVASPGPASQPAAAAAPPKRDLKKMAAAAAAAAASNAAVRGMVETHTPASAKAQYAAAQKAVAAATAPPPEPESSSEDGDSSASFESHDSDDEEDAAATAAAVAANAKAAAKEAKKAGLGASVSATAAAAAAATKAKAALGASMSGKAGPAAAAVAATVSPPRPTFEAPFDEPAAKLPPPSDGTLNGLFSAALPEEPMPLARKSMSKSAGGDLPAYTWGSYAPEVLESMCLQRPAGLAEVKRFDVPREQGRCIGPVDGEPGDAPVPLSFQKMAVDFFAAKQSVVVPSPTLVEYTQWAAAAADTTGVNHERRAKGQLAMSEAQFSHELGGSLEDPASTRRAASEAVAIPLDTIAANPAAAVASIAAKYSDCDVVQLLEAARDSKQPVPATAAKIWTYDYEPRGAVPMPPMFRDGVLYSVTVKDCWTNLQHLSGPDVEPTFGSLAIYCISSKEAKRVSETFYFDVNIEANKNKFFASKPIPHQANRLRRFVTFIPSAFRHSDLYVVTKLHRLATDDHDSAMDMYLRPGAWVKTKRHFDKHVDRLGQYASSPIGEIATEIGWACAAMRTPNGLFQGTSVVDKLFATPRFTIASDAFIFDHITNSKTKNLKQIMCTITLECADVSKYEVSVARTSPNAAAAIEEESLLAIRAAPDRPQELVRHCPTVFPILNAGFFNTFSNAMYVNLQSLNLYRLATKEARDAKHFVVKVALKDNDNDLYEDEGIPCIFTRWFGQDIVATSALSQVVVGLKDCELCDEFKIQLPLVLQEKHHLLFTIYAVTIDNRSGVPKPLVPVGYAFKPIFPNRRILPASQIGLPVIIGGPASAALKAGYLTNKNVADSSYVLDGSGSKVFNISTSLRSTVYSEVPLIADIFNDFQPILQYSLDTRKGGNILETPGRIANHKVESKSETDIVRRLTEIEHLAQPEKLAFYPRFASFLLALVCAPSYNIGTRARCLAFKAFARVSSEVNQLESAGARPPLPRTPASPQSKQPVPPRAVPLTSPVKFVYHYMTEQLLFDGDARYDVALGVTEILTAELIRSRRNEQLQSYKALINNHLWLFFDLILKGIYLAANRPRAVRVAAAPAAEPPVAVKKSSKKAAAAAAAAAATSPPKTISVVPNRADLFGEPFYAAIYTLVDEVIETFIKGENRGVVARAALFLRNVSLVADRGHTLSVFQAFMRRLIGKQCVANIDTALTTFTDGAVTFVTTLGPRTPLDASPCGIVRVMLRRVLPLMWDATRDLRRRGQDLLYRLIVRTSRQVAKLAPEETLETLARGLMSYVAAMACFYPRLIGIINKDKTSTQSSSSLELRFVLAPFLWVLQWAPTSLIRAFIAGITNPTMLTGLLAMLRDSFILFRHSPPSSKLTPGMKASEQQVKALLPWDSRLEAQAYSLCVRAMSMVVSEHATGLLRCVAEYPTPAVAANFFGALDVALSIGAPTTMLQAGACLLRQVVNELSVDLLGGRAALAQRVVASALHLMTSASPAVRGIAGQTLLHFARRHFELHGELAKFHVMCVSESIRVAEHDCKDRPKAAESFSTALASLVDDCGEHWTVLTLAERAGFVPSSEAAKPTATATAAAGPTPTTSVPKKASNPLSVRSVFSVPGGESEANRRLMSARGSPDFAGSFERTIDVCTEFFAVVSRMAQSSHFEVKTIAVFDLVRKLLKDRALGEAIRWLRELATMHGKQAGAVEGGLAVFCMAAIVFRATQLYYHIFGEAAGGAAIPFATVSEHLHWHHFTRVFPQVERLATEEDMHLIVAEHVNLPPLPEFSLAGLTDLLRDAGDRLARAYHYELAVPVLTMVQALTTAAQDYSALATVSDDVRKCATALTRGNSSRLSARFFAVTVHGAKLAETVQWVIRYPESSSMGIEGFRKVAIGIAEAVSGAARDDVELREDLSAEDMIKITAEAKAARSKKGRKSASSLKKAAAPDAPADDDSKARKVYVACHAVAPYFPDGDERSRGGIDSLQNLASFSCKIQMVDRTAVLESGVQSLGTAFSMNDEARAFEPLARRQRIVIHHLARAFPSLTSAVAVDASEESTLDPVATAIADIKDHRSTLAGIAPDCPPAFAIKQAIAALTPFNIRPAGFYFKAVLHALGHDEELRAVAAEFVEELKNKSGIFQSAAARDPETLAKFIKATIDVECALSDAIDTAKAAAAAEAAAEADSDEDDGADADEDALLGNERSMAMAPDDDDDIPAEFEGGDTTGDDEDDSDDTD